MKNRKKTLTRAQARSNSVKIHAAKVKEFALLRGTKIYPRLMRIIEGCLELAFMDGQSYQIDRDHELLNIGAKDAVLRAAIGQSINELAGIQETASGTKIQVCKGMTSQGRKCTRLCRWPSHHCYLHQRQAAHHG